MLYAVTDRSWLGEQTLCEQVEEALKGGATFIQLREKELDDESFLAEAIEIQKLCRQYRVPFVINDNVEIARKINADGVHVGQSDMEAGDVRSILGEDKILGVSAQTVAQAVLAEQRGADYLGVGAVFQTGSKADADDVSHETLKAIYLKARDADARAAFGSVIAFNEEVDADTAREIMSTFCECVVAPSYAPGVLDIFNDGET